MEGWEEVSFKVGRGVGHGKWVDDGCKTEQARRRRRRRVV